jgi:hypothetical protein
MKNPHKPGAAHGNFLCAILGNRIADIIGSKNCNLEKISELRASGGI